MCYLSFEQPIIGFFVVDDLQGFQITGIILVDDLEVLGHIKQVSCDQGLDLQSDQALGSAKLGLLIGNLLLLAQLDQLLQEGFIHHKRLFISGKGGIGSL